MKAKFSVFACVVIVLSILASCGLGDKPVKGGSLTVSMSPDGSAAVDAAGFVGMGCHEAREALGIGTATEIHGKREGLRSLATVSAGAA